MIISINCMDGTHVLRMAHSRAFPKEVGDRKFNASTRTGIVERIRQVYKACRKVSPLMREDMQLYFGPRDYWEVKELRLNPVTNAEIPWQPEDDYLKVKKNCRRRTVDVELTGKGKRGLYWVLYLWVHPESSVCFGPGLQEEIAWSLAAQIKCVKQLEEEIGLDKAEVPEIRWDDEREEDAKGEAGEGAADKKTVEPKKEEENKEER